MRVIDERPHEIKITGGTSLWVHDLGMTYANPGELDNESLRQLFQNSFEQIWHGRVENDGFNRLVLLAQLPWRQVIVLRACGKYLRQTGFSFSQHYMEQTLAHHPQIARLLVDLFLVRFDPTQQHEADKRAALLQVTIEQSLDNVPNLDEDRILRRFFTLIKALLRTNFFQTNSTGEPKEYLSFKLDSRQIPDLPEPKPLYEIFVYSPRVEAIHLRGGKVARGGIRWSNRPEDFRTEVFGLMKTQMVKNAVIVPVGAKGGFVVKQPPSGTDADALAVEVKQCYSLLIRGLLDITDNLTGNVVTPPANVVRYDTDDPYLVVAADKGTATFSDTANGIAKEYGFWLGDAFASGGSAGYDHKKMGITAKGGWESVKRHFREMGRDMEHQAFTLVGIGSMSGDVFGNGLLLSRQAKLIAAFSHQHIFLDPDPHPDASFAERERLFQLRRSSWLDYNPALISMGGGVFSRSAKTILLSEPVQRSLAIHSASLTPNELIQAILKAPVDLIWNGGIGTFVKASFESHRDVGDRTNDGLRINATELRAKVIGEGGNLGLTANGRIEYALAGGRINTDFIDNSGGVDCSDHEVNIKILMQEALNEGAFNEKQRNTLLAEMENEVAELVLHNNYQQTQAISLVQRSAYSQLDEHCRFVAALERSGRLDRLTWNLPSNAEINRRRTLSLGLTRPELAILLSYSKIDLFDALISSDICAEAYLSRELDNYFPRPMRDHFAARLPSHRLRNEIIATFVTNNFINRMGPTFPHRIMEHTGAKPADITRAYIAARDVFAIPTLWQTIESLDNQIAATLQLDMLIESNKLISRATLWFLRNRKQPLDISAAVNDFQAGVQTLRTALSELLDAHQHQQLTLRRDYYTQQGVTTTLAQEVALLPLLFLALDITEVAATLGREVSGVGKLYFHLGALLDLHWVRDRITALPEESHWPTLARAALRDDLLRLQRTLTREALLQSGDRDLSPTAILDHWSANNQITVERYLQHLSEFKASELPDLAMLSVAVNEARKLVQTTGRP